ncbi:MAG: hypothetical protein Q4D14_06735 [Bacteroidales bacterium]|nr:hypothetical protein [Bacteroidales bacterium]
MEKIKKLFEGDKEILCTLDIPNSTLVLRVLNNPVKSFAIEQLLDCPPWCEPGVPRVVVITEDTNSADYDTLLEAAFDGNTCISEQMLTKMQTMSQEEIRKLLFN